MKPSALQTCQYSKLDSVNFRTDMTWQLNPRRLFNQHRETKVANGVKPMGKPDLQRTFSSAHIPVSYNTELRK